eukprot:5382610-Heterocapsa_arctica.AAC.1
MTAMQLDVSSLALSTKQKAARVITVFLLYVLLQFSGMMNEPMALTVAIIMATAWLSIRVDDEDEAPDTSSFGTTTLSTMASLGTSTRVDDEDEVPELMPEPQ